MTNIFIVRDDIDQLMHDCLTEIRASRSLTTEDACPHCGVPVRQPIMLRDRDRKDMQAFMRSVCRIADRRGITAEILAEIKADCMINAARIRSKRNG